MEQVFRDIEAVSEIPIPVGLTYDSVPRPSKFERFTRGPVFGAEDVCLGRTVSDGAGRFSMMLDAAPPDIYVGAYGPLGGDRCEIRNPTWSDEPVLIEVKTRGVLAFSVRFTGGRGDDLMPPPKPLGSVRRAAEVWRALEGRLIVRVTDAQGGRVRATSLNAEFDAAGCLRLFACGLAPGPAEVEFFVDGGAEPVARVPGVEIASDAVTIPQGSTLLDLDRVVRPVRLTLIDYAGLPLAGVSLRKVTPRRGSPEDRSGSPHDDRLWLLFSSPKTDVDGRVTTFVPAAGDDFAFEGEDCEPVVVRGVATNRDLVLTRRHAVALEFSTAPAFEAVLHEFAARSFRWITVLSFQPAEGPVVVTEHLGSLGAFRTSRPGTLTIRFTCRRIFKRAASPEWEFIGEPCEIPLTGTEAVSVYVPPPSADAIRRAAEALSARLYR